MEIRNVTWRSKDYNELVQLRIHALLQPIGIPSSYIEPEKEKDDHFIGAFVEDQIIGCCVLTAKENGVVQLRQMAVLPGLQKKGVGAAIIRFAEEKATSLGFTTLMMHARDPVIGFYEKCGYKITGPQFFEVGMGHHKMEKTLTQKT